MNVKLFIFFKQILIFWDPIGQTEWLAVSETHKGKAVI